MTGVVTEHAKKFLGHSTLPSLEAASIDTIGKMCIAPPAFTQEQGSTVSEAGALKVPTLSVPKDDFKAPSLKQLTISSTLFACFSLFMGCPLENLSVGNDERYMGERPWINELDVAFADRLTEFHPRCLRLFGFSYHNTLFIIRSLGIQGLRDLTVELSLYYRDPETRCAALQSAQRIHLPSLESFIWSGYEHEFAHFISHLDAARLEQLTITFFHSSELGFEEWDRENALGSNPLLAVKRVQYNLLITRSFPDHWKFLPNVEELSITFTRFGFPSHTGLPDGETELKDLEEGLTTITRNLRMNIRSKTHKIPRLRLLSISYGRHEVSSYPGLSHEQIRVMMIGSILEAQQNLEFPRFILDGPVRLSDEKSRNWWESKFKEVIEVKFVIRIRKDEARQDERNAEFM